MALPREHIGYHKQVGMKALFDVLAPASEDYALARAIDPDRLPSHIAIIMDGNGRWAKRRRLPRAAGHRAGVTPVRSTVETCARLGLRALTLYAFSVENWKRPRAEVETLWRLLRRYLRAELDLMHRHDIRFTAIGRLHALPDFVRDELDSVIRSTAGNQGLQLNLAINYGGRAEIVDAVAALVRDAVALQSGDARLGEHGGAWPRPTPCPTIDEAAISARLYTAGMPDPDLLIRTSGEMRVSNFLLWQIAYAELYVTETLWPDFSRGELLRAILDYQKRDRRFGGLPSSSLIDAPHAERMSENTTEDTSARSTLSNPQPNPERNIDPDVESGTVETVGVPMTRSAQ
jgi:undecaprenyl diphosphate synthase